MGRTSSLSLQHLCADGGQVRLWLGAAGRAVGVPFGHGRPRRQRAKRPQSALIQQYPVRNLNDLCRNPRWWARQTRWGTLRGAGLELPSSGPASRVAHPAQAACGVNSVALQARKIRDRRGKGHILWGVPEVLKAELPALAGQGLAAFLGKNQDQKLPRCTASPPKDCCTGMISMAFTFMCLGAWATHSTVLAMSSGVMKSTPS